jgi:branched-chain amino acid transport system permease protein
VEGVFQYLANGIFTGGMYALIALSIVVITKATGVFNFASGSMLMAAGVFVWVFIVQMGMPIWLGILLTLLILGIMGVFIQRAVLHPLLGQPILSSIMATIGLLYFIFGIMMYFSRGLIQGLAGILPEKTIYLGSVALSEELLLTFIICIAMFGIVAAFFRYTGLGLEMRAAAEDTVLGQAKGIRMGRIFALTWAFAGVMLGVAGILVGLTIGTGQHVINIPIRVFPAVIIGGLESIPGALIGGLIVGIIESLTGGLISSWAMEMSPYIVLLFALIFIPHGIFGLRRIERI